ncbi:MAG TPA: hypothetical protein VFE51_08575 [Verrucomicrobiae bacterium]|nr:hypothetical protein [Verrucomicrobiae bacterium]
MKIPIEQRNREILELRRQGLSQTEVARKFQLSPTRIYLIEKQDAADRSMEQRRAKLQEEIRAADDLERMWPVEDLIDALGSIVVTRKRLVDHFVAAGKHQISLREFMDICLDGPVEGLDFMMSPLLRIYGIGKKGFWSVVIGLTRMHLGNRCNQEWQWRFVKVKQKWGITGPTPYSSGWECPNTANDSQRRMRRIHLFLPGSSSSPRIIIRVSEGRQATPMLSSSPS